MKRSMIANLAILAGAVFAYRKLPGKIFPKIPVGKPSDPCPAGQKRRLVNGKWICTLKFD